MAVSFEQIEPELFRLRDFVLNDLQRIVDQDVGDNYAAAGLISSTYDALGDLRGVGSDVPFAEQLPQQWRPVAKSLYGALRNGLVHHYDPKLIVVDGRAVELVISWRQQPHLSLQGGRLYLNVQQMAADLRTAFDDYEHVLHADPALRDRFLQKGRKDREAHVHNYVEAEAWRALLDSACERSSHP